MSHEVSRGSCVKVKGPWNALANMRGPGLYMCHRSPGLDLELDPAHNRGYLLQIQTKFVGDGLEGSSKAVVLLGGRTTTRYCNQAKA